MRDRGRRAPRSCAFARNKAVSVACRRPSHLSLLAQSKVAQRNGLVQSADPTSQKYRGLRSHSRLRDTRHGHAASYLETEDTKPRGATRRLGFALAVASARWERAAFPGPLGGGEAGTIRPRSGRVQGWTRLFAWAEPVPDSIREARSKSPATPHALSVQGWTESAAAGWPSLLTTFLLATQEKSSSAAGRRAKPLCRLRSTRSRNPFPQHEDGTARPPRTPTPHPAERGRK